MVETKQKATERKPSRKPRTAMPQDAKTPEPPRSGKEPAPAPPPGAYDLRDPELLTRNLLRFYEDGGKVWSTLLGRVGPMAPTPEMNEAARAFGEVSNYWLGKPNELSAVQARLARDFMELWQRAFRRAMGQPVEPVIRPEPGDQRFKDPDWDDHPYFDLWKQSYLITTHWLEGLVSKADGLDERTLQRAEFYLRQFTSAASPSNFPFTNPEVLRETMATSGENLLQGLTNLRNDLARSGDMLNISQSDLSAFEVGRNVAVTPGKVVYQNDIMQLIQYTPTTESVYRVPILIVPPWINKFYILDLQPAKSFIKFAVDQGFSVFVVSWVNPDLKLAHKTFEDYMQEGILAAADAVSRATDVHKINVLGYCVGGTLLGTTLAWLAAKGEERFRSASFLAAQVDFSKAGDLLVFIDDAQLKSLEEMMAERGVLDGSRMAQVFNMLRPRDLIWPYIVNNYLLGKKPLPFDLLFWNQDSTRMPAANHAFYLREFYHENRLAKGTMRLAGRKLDLKKVTLPIYELAAREDHIAPAASVYIGARLFGGPVRYVMSGSGHIAGVINPAGGKVKYQYWTNDELPARLEDWQTGAKESPGSWWPDWAEWLASHSGEMISARVPGDGLEAIEDAPGSYVRVKA